MARRHQLLGIALDGDEIVVAVSDPGDVIALGDVRAATGMKVRLVVVSRDELLQAAERFRPTENDLDADGLRKASAGETTLAEVLRVAV